MMKNNYSAIISLLVFIALLCLSLTPLPVLSISSSPLIKTKGYAMGQLSRIGRDNLQLRFSSDSYIGELFLGHDSASLISFGSQPLNLVTNPFQFCLDEDLYEQLEAYIGVDIVIEYKTPRRNSLLSCTSVNELLDIYPVDEDLSIKQAHFVGEIYNFDFEVAHGIEFGRITNVIEDKRAFRSFFMTMQISDSGNRFRHFISDDRELFHHAINILKKGVLVKVHYSERLANRGVAGHRTRLFISEIEVVSDND